MEETKASTWLTESARQTEKVAVELKERWRSCEAIALVGPLGAGKTTFIRGMVRGLGGDAAEVRSPTFTLLNNYPETAPPLVHADLYRIDSRKNQLTAGIEDYFGSSLVVVEWAEKWKLTWPEKILTVELSYCDREKRQIVLKEDPPLAVSD